MTEQSPGQDRPDDWSRGYGPGDRGGYYSGDQYHGPAPAGSGRPGPGRPGSGWPGPGGAGAARPAPEDTGPGMAGPGMPTTPIWQGAPPPPGAAQPAYHAGPQQAGLGQTELGQTELGQAGPGHGADTKGFLGALFDFSFTSFVTTRIIKVLYVLIMILAVITALVYTIVAFRISGTFGFLTLVIGDPLFIIIVMGFWRLVLESFVVRFRIAEDVRAMRERGGR